MAKFNPRFATNALLLAAAFGVTGVSDALAQKKLSYDQAWAACKAQVDRTVAGDQQGPRATAGASCMQKYGYRLKKKI